MKRKLIAVLCAVILFVVVISYHTTIINIAWAAPDVHGNDIQFIEVWQWNGTHYNLAVNFTSSGGTQRVVDSQPINFTVSIKLNSTLVSSTAEAISYTSVYMNISGGIWTNAELNNTACSLVGSFYILTEEGHWNQTGKPEAGITYECSVLYQAYY